MKRKRRRGVHRLENTHTRTHTLHKHTRGRVDVSAISLIKSRAYILYLIVRVQETGGERHELPREEKKVMKHHWRGFYRDTVRNTNSRYLFSSIRIHYASECIIGGVAIDPVLNLIVRFLFSSEPGGSGSQGGVRVCVWGG